MLERNAAARVARHHRAWWDVTCDDRVWRHDGPLADGDPAVDHAVVADPRSPLYAKRRAREKRGLSGRAPIQDLRPVVDGVGDRAAVADAGVLGDLDPVPGDEAHVVTHVHPVAETQDDC